MRMEAANMSWLIRLFLCGLFVMVAPAAETLKVGDALPAFSAKDQHGQEFQLKAGVRYLFVSFDMSTGKKANAFFAAKEPEYLDKMKGVYVSNIHGMPAIGRAFALPRMRKYPHRIVLADSADLLRAYPTEKEKVTILVLDPNLKITAIHFWDPEKDLPAGVKN